MVPIPFSISEFVIDPDGGVPLDVADKILKHHIKPMLGFRIQRGFPIYVSQGSGYRSKEYETLKGRIPGRNGRTKWSEHTYYEGSLGATDWTTKPGNMLELAEFLCSQESPYRRIAYYEDEGFFHCDYAGLERQYRLGNGWVKTNKETLLQKVRKNYGT